MRILNYLEFKQLKEDKSTLDEFSTIDTKNLADLKIDPEWAVPQVGSKNFDYDIVDDKIAFKDFKHDPEKQYDFIINSNGDFLIGSGHFKLAKKSDVIKGAGTIKINKDGKISYLDNESGHYKPQKCNLDSAFQTFKELNLVSDNVQANCTF